MFCFEASASRKLMIYIQHKKVIIILIIIKVLIVVLLDVHRIVGANHYLNLFINDCGQTCDFNFIN